MDCAYEAFIRVYERTQPMDEWPMTLMGSGGARIWGISTYRGDCGPGEVPSGRWTNGGRSSSGPTSAVGGDVIVCAEHGCGVMGAAGDRLASCCSMPGTASR